MSPKKWRFWKFWIFQWEAQFPLIFFGENNLDKQLFRLTLSLSLSHRLTELELYWFVFLFQFLPIHSHVCQKGGCCSQWKLCIWRNPIYSRNTRRLKLVCHFTTQQSFSNSCGHWPRFYVNQPINQKCPRLIVFCDPSLTKPLIARTAIWWT